MKEVIGVWVTDNYLKHRREELKISSRQFDEAMGLSSATSFLSGSKGMGGKWIDKLAEVLQLDVNEVVKHIEATQTDKELIERFPDIEFVPKGHHKKPKKIREAIHKEKPNAKLEKLVAESRRHSRTYGDYMAMLYCEQEQTVMDRWREYNLKKNLGIRE